MIKKILLASATAGLIATGTLAASTVGASAGSSGYGVQIGSGTFSIGYRGHQQRGCRATYRRVQWWDYYGRPHWKRVRVANCRPGKHQKAQRRHRHGHGGGYSSQGGYGYGSQGSNGYYGGNRGSFGFTFGW